MLNLVKFFHKIKELVGGRIYILLVLITIVGFVEGIGVTLFFPILQSGFGDDKLSSVMKFMFSIFHLKYSFNLILALIAIFFILRSVFLVSYMRYFARLSSNLLIDLRRKILKKIFAADYLYLLKKEVGYMTNSITREISRVVDAFDTFAYVFNYSLFAIIYLTLSLVINLQLTAIVVIITPVLVNIMRKVNLLAGQASRNQSNSYGIFQSILFQALNKLKYIKSTFTSGQISGVIDKKNKDIGLHTFKLVFFHSLTRYPFEAIFVLVIVGFLFYHVSLMNRSVNEIIFLSFLLLQIARQFISAQSTYRRFISSIGSIETFNGLEGELKEKREDLNLNGIQPDFAKDITLKNVTVIFPNGKKALINVNVTIKTRSVVAFVGHSGSGKSTIANIITGILKPTSGTVLFGSTDYKNLNLKALRENIGYVTQEDVIFNASIRDNISLWSDDMDTARLKKVIELAHIKGFVNGLPEKYDSMLGDNGLDISGGQRQRITIARELYKNTKLLIMDEATSSLDSKSEKQIYENLKEFRGKKTMVVIAHRLSTIRNADYIYVLDDGKIVEEGTYEDLYGRLGEFTTMVNDQKVC